VRIVILIQAEEGIEKVDWSSQKTKHVCVYSNCVLY